MPFSSLTDPGELARASAALEAAWSKIRTVLPDETGERQRTRLAYIVASLVSVAADEEDLTRRAVERYRQSV